MYRVFLGLGSNLGDRGHYLARALAELREIAEIEKVSSVFETSPSGMTSENLFYNLAVEVTTPLNPPRLLHAVKAIERKLGRTPGTHLKDREIDIDILLYDHLYYEDHELQVPHPELAQRRFALVPLCEIAPKVVDPFSNSTMEHYVKNCPDATDVRKTDLVLTRPLKTA